jgi:hypothetical protein
MGLQGLRVGEVKGYVQEGKIDPVYTSAARRNGGLEERAALPVTGIGG